ncbi:DUF454 domain-containing protein [Bermanella marisrubri]|uniref:Inner membrane protein n=1 Tax=Bermanella marisrubri TaxID=207949 RepID=Q1N4G0_9GAMM|nr:YbaN family protein [Bermanella marisrubri]EAT13152.1 hypothetical protein RED65_00290 [Oceanobacter sp. RED65] [Bermanella marisrubri]QIZ83926.1 DUF454 domain-containing protein [Bermanella marisrubri]
MNKRILHYFLIGFGWISVVLGVVGIFLPLLPTTPFLLLAAACFVRSSPRFYNWLVQHPKLGNYIIHYLEGNGIPLRGKIMAITMIWVTMGISIIWVVPVWWVKWVLAAIGLSVSIYIARQPTLNSDLPAIEARPQHDDS